MTNIWRHDPAGIAADVVLTAAIAAVLAVTSTVALSAGDPLVRASAGNLGLCVLVATVVSVLRTFRRGRTSRGPAAAVRRLWNIGLYGLAGIGGGAAVGLAAALVVGIGSLPLVGPYALVAVYVVWLTTLPLCVPVGIGVGVSRGCVRAL